MEVVAAVEADLASAAGADVVRAAVADVRADGPIVVSCLDVLHQLADFTAAVELLLGLGETAAVVLSVPDDAAGALDDPHRRSAWSAGAAEELRRLLPAGAVVARQVPVRGGRSCPPAPRRRACRWGASPSRRIARPHITCWRSAPELTASPRSR